MDKKDKIILIVTMSFILTGIAIATAFIIRKYRKGKSGGSGKLPLGINKKFIMYLNPTTKQEKFIQQYADDIRKATKSTNIFPSVKMAQFILESGWGDSIFANNGFGIKASGSKTPYWDGSATVGNTTEVYNGVVKQIKAGFRSYQNVQDSIKDHTYLLENAKRNDGKKIYQSVLDSNTPEEQATNLQNSGYATSPTYANTLISLINKYGLKKLDS
jgi:flagellum-specific peptidoglycan hydrolase FlgJ